MCVEEKGLRKYCHHCKQTVIVAASQNIHTHLKQIMSLYSYNVKCISTGSAHISYTFDHRVQEDADRSLYPSFLQPVDPRVSVCVVTLERLQRVTSGGERLIRCSIRTDSPLIADSNDHTCSVLGTNTPFHSLQHKGCNTQKKNTSLAC